MGRTAGALNKPKVHKLDSMSAHLQEVKTFKVRYEFSDYEGGIAVYVSYGEYGERIVSIPRLSISTCVLHDSDVFNMLLKDRGFYNRRNEAEQFSTMILRDIQLYRHK